MPISRLGALGFDTAKAGDSVQTCLDGTVHAQEQDGVRRTRASRQELLYRARRLHGFYLQYLYPPNSAAGSKRSGYMEDDGKLHRGLSRLCRKWRQRMLGSRTRPRRNIPKPSLFPSDFFGVQLSNH